LPAEGFGWLLGCLGVLLDFGLRELDRKSDLLLAVFFDLLPFFGISPNLFFPAFLAP
jgi:hypothetical protein